MIRLAATEVRSVRSKTDTHAKKKKTKPKHRTKKFPERIIISVNRNTHAEVNVPVQKLQP